MGLEAIPGEASVKVPRVPRGMGAGGRRLWRAVLADYELDAQGLELLEQAGRTADRIADLEAVVDRDGVMAESSQGPRAHPALVEARQQRTTLRQLIGALGLDPDRDGDETGRARAAALTRSAKARAAARARWGAGGFGGAS